MKIRAATDWDVYLVCRNMRRANAEEAKAIRGHEDRARMARELNGLAALAAFRDALTLDSGEVVAIVAAYRVADTAMAAVHMMATEKWPQIGKPAFRYLRRLVASFPARGIRYAATDVLDRGFADREWLRRLGFMDEGSDGVVQRVAWRAPVDAPPAALASELPTADREVKHVFSVPSAVATASATAPAPQ